MKLQEIIRDIAAETKREDVAIEAIIKAFLSKVQAELRDGGKVEIGGFGVFKVLQRAERTMTHPQTKKEITIPAHRIPHFTPYKSFKKNFN